MCRKLDYWRKMHMVICEAKTKAVGEGEQLATTVSQRSTLLLP